jgi:hypothetical protein
MEIELRPVLPMIEHSRDEPTLSRHQFQTLGQPSPLKDNQGQSSPLKFQTR